MFKDNAREAASFYTSIFPDSELLDNWIAPTDTPGNQKGEEIVVNFRIFGKPFIGLNMGSDVQHSYVFSFQIPCSNQAEIDRYWKLLTENGGEESQCGWLIDRFGISWQVTSPEMLHYLNGDDVAGAERATKAMMQMKKIDLDVLKRAYFDS